MEELTARQKEIFEFIQEHMELRERPPSMREIAKEFGFSSTNGVSQHLDALERKGYIRRRKFISRGIELLMSRHTSLPVTGAIAAGAPIEALEDIEELDLDEMLLHKGCYLLRVKGNSMIEDSIREGDYVIVEPRTTAENGEIVVAILGDNEATLKRFYREKNRVRLQPANSSLNPIYTEHVEIRGVVAGILRKY